MTTATAAINSESPPDNLAVDRFDTPVTFCVTTDPDGEDTLLPIEVELNILTGEFDLSDDEYDIVCGGIGDDERSWVYYAFERSAVDDAEAVIEAVQDLLDNYNTPPEKLNEEQKAEWRQATVIITDVQGVDIDDSSGDSADSASEESDHSKEESVSE